MYVLLCLSVCVSGTQVNVTFHYISLSLVNMCGCVYATWKHLLLGVVGKIM